MKKLIDSDISKFITSFNCPIVCIDWNEEITWDEYMEIYNVMKDCAENRKLMATIYYYRNDGELDAEDIRVHIGIPSKVNEKTEEGDFHYSFFFEDAMLEIRNIDGEYKITINDRGWACGFYPNDPADVNHKGLGKIDEWL